MSGIGIVRRWTARATPVGARKYVRFFEETLVPALARIEGHRGALVTLRLSGEGVEIAVETKWESMEAVRRFAGEMVARAVVEPEAQALLTSFDEEVTHLEVAVDTVNGRAPK